MFYVAISKPKYDHIFMHMQAAYLLSKTSKNFVRKEQMSKKRKKEKRTPWYLIFSECYFSKLNDQKELNDNLSIKFYVSALLTDHTDVPKLAFVRYKHGKFIPFDGVPFMIMGKYFLTCFLGRNKHKSSQQALRGEKLQVNCFKQPSNSL